jgi:hypothetical protein
MQQKHAMSSQPDPTISRRKMHQTPQIGILWHGRQVGKFHLNIDKRDE